MTKNQREDLNKYASSSFSGADIRVIANLNTYGLNKVRKRILELQQDVKDLYSSQEKLKEEIAFWLDVKAANEGIINGGTNKAEYDAAVAEVLAAEAALKAERAVSDEIHNIINMVYKPAVASAYTAQHAAVKKHLHCLGQATGSPPDTSGCDVLMNDDWSGATLAFMREELEIKGNLWMESIERGLALQDALEEKEAQVKAIKKHGLTLGENLKKAIEEIKNRQARLRTCLDPLQDLQDQLAEFQKILNNSSLELGTVQTISCQSHRPKAAVRALGSTYARGYTRGPRTIAGSMIFTVINKQSLGHLCNLMSAMFNSKGNDILPSTILPDQLLPIDLTFLMANEYGAVSRMALYGLEFLNSGYTFSIEDLLLEEVVQFVARDIDPMSSTFDPQNHQTSRQDALRDKPLTGKQTLRDFLVTTQKTLDRRRF
tara:strand:+ start:1214 stop:2506 length:1293 start_codon:yes stop_codon:yes gene_type:complete